MCIDWFAYKHIAWTPYTIVALLGIAGRKDLITPIGSMVPALFCKLASCLDPYIYALSHSKFKDALQQIFKIHSAKKIDFKPYFITDSATGHSNLDADDGVIEEVVLVNVNRLQSQMDKASGQENSSCQVAVSQPSWWARPSFNDSSGLAKARKLVRSMSITHGKEGEEEIEK
ncbi:opsin [Holotrichia oblita]|uniref:Opsin n=1 Tax=Holotrichia oblita TaxID=644536 RepID=A0ACB9ST23_HOLOL|nr:opsin [Holotrichia oblita]